MNPCTECCLEAFKRNEPLNFKGEMKELEIKLDVLFIKHFGQKIVKVFEDRSVSRLVSDLSERSRQYLGAQQSQLAARQQQACYQQPNSGGSIMGAAGQQLFGMRGLFN